MNNFKAKLYQFMAGRYGGNDALNKTLLWGYLAIILIGAVTGLEFLWYVGLLAFGWNICRLFSRNMSARQKENLAFLNLKNKIVFTARGLFDRKRAYRVCPHCKAQLRLPRKKGIHTVSCPRCHKDFKVKI